MPALPFSQVPFSRVLPAPSRLIALLDPRVPLGLKRGVVEPLLNRTFAEPLAEGEFDALEGRRVTLDVEDLGVRLTLTLADARFALTTEPGEATIRGGWREFLCLATRREDPDAMFFQRRLSIEGDTELGLTVKNLLDGLEEGFTEGRLGAVLRQLDTFAARV